MQFKKIHREGINTLVIVIAARPFINLSKGMFMHTKKKESKTLDRKEPKPEKHKSREQAKVSKTAGTGWIGDFSGNRRAVPLMVSLVFVHRTAALATE